MNNHILKIHKRHLLLEKQGYKSVNLATASIIEVVDTVTGKDFTFYCNLKKTHYLGVAYDLYFTVNKNP